MGFSTEIQSVHIPYIKTFLFCAGEALSDIQDGRKKNDKKFFNVIIFFLHFSY